MSEVMRWKLKGFLPGVEGMCKAVMRPEVVMASDFDAAQSELAALREELAKYKGGCVDLSSQVRELEHKMDYWKGEGKRADEAQQRLTAAEQRNSELIKAIVDTREALGREYWDQYAGLDETRDILDAALKPTESGASE
ncbi:hypothetical protein JQF37_01740 [Pseudomonas sp. MIL9]|uniref:hypothetical protein n=1 Tax=Pseudomonas sp. MIL9 TaxID=2807620 RepID=UPI00194E6F9C|nr:hypothetical protein [Pseudomonas sp. MIL9]MBM6442350.1 hypothetical protein [Pseudomonas sp. MIL9]